MIFHLLHIQIVCFIINLAKNFKRVVCVTRKYLIFVLSVFLLCTFSLSTLWAASSPITYKSYGNGRYGFTIDYPSTFKPGRPPDNGDGLVFTSPDKTAELRAFGGIVIDDDEYDKTTALSEFKYTLLQHDDVISAQFYGNWFTISWREYSNIFYQKTVVGSVLENTFLLTYPSSQKAYYDKIILQLLKSFKTPAIDLPY